MAFWVAVTGKGQAVSSIVLLLILLPIHSLLCSSTNMFSGPGPLLGAVESVVKETCPSGVLELELELADMGPRKPWGVPALRHSVGGLKLTPAMSRGNQQSLQSGVLFVCLFESLLLCVS